MMKDIKKDYKIKGIELLNFVNLKEDSLDNILEWRDHKDVRDWMFNDKKITLEEHRSFINSLKKLNNRVHFLVKRQNLNLGVIQIYDLDFNHKRGTWGYFINPEIKNYGGGVLLGYLALELAFGIFKLNSFYSTTLKGNKASLRINEFLGMSNDGVMREYIYRDQEKVFLDVIQACILSREWKDKKVEVENLIRMIKD